MYCYFVGFLLPICAACECFNGGVRIDCHLVTVSVLPVVQSFGLYGGGFLIEILPWQACSPGGVGWFCSDIWFSRGIRYLAPSGYVVGSIALLAVRSEFFLMGFFVSGPVVFCLALDCCSIVRKSFV